MNQERNHHYQQLAADQIYDYAAMLLVEKNMSPDDVEGILIHRGLDEETATLVVESIDPQILELDLSRANLNMVFGSLWCVGGLAATIAGLGYIFLVATAFGAFQFVRGMAIG